MAILQNFDDGQNEPAKILKRKKNQSFYYQNHTKSFSAHGQSKVFPLNQT